MSLSRVRPAFEKTAKALGYTVVSEAFSKDAVPADRGARAFIDPQSAEAARGQNYIQYDIPVFVDLFAGASRNTVDLEAKAYEAAEKFVGQAFKTVTGNGIVRCICTAIEPQPINSQNDNAVIVHLEFGVVVVADF